MGKRVLFLEQNEKIATSFSERFEAQGIELVTVGSGQEVVDVLDKDEFDLLLIDINIPDMRLGQLVRQVSKEHPSMIFNVCVDVLNSLLISKLVNRYAIHKIYVAPWDVEEMIDGIEDSIECARILADKREQEMAIYKEKEEFDTTLESLMLALKKQQYSYKKLSSISSKIMEGIKDFSPNDEDEETLREYKWIENSFDTYLRYQTTGSLDADTFEDQLTNDLRNFARENNHFSLGEVTSCLIGGTARATMADVRFAIWLIAKAACDSSATCKVSVNSDYSSMSAVRFVITVKGKQSQRNERGEKFVMTLLESVTEKAEVNESEDEKVYCLDFITKGPNA